MLERIVVMIFLLNISRVGGGVHSPYEIVHVLTVDHRDQHTPLPLNKTIETINHIDQHTSVLPDSELSIIVNGKPMKRMDVRYG